MDPKSFVAAAGAKKRSRQVDRSSTTCAFPSTDKSSGIPRERGEGNSRLTKGDKGKAVATEARPPRATSGVDHLVANLAGLSVKDSEWVDSHLLPSINQGVEYATKAWKRSQEKREAEVNQLKGKNKEMEVSLKSEKKKRVKAEKELDAANRLVEEITAPGSKYRQEVAFDFASSAVNELRLSAFVGGPVVRYGEAAHRQGYSQAGGDMSTYDPCPYDILSKGYDNPWGTPELANYSQSEFAPMYDQVYGYYERRSNEMENFYYGSSGGVMPGAEEATAKDEMRDLDL